MIAAGNCITNPTRGETFAMTFHLQAVACFGSLFCCSAQMLLWCR